MNVRSSWEATKQTASEFSEDNVMTWAAALAFYAALALPPLLTIMAWLTQFLGQAWRDRIQSAFSQVLGQQAAEPIGQIMARADTPSMTVAGIISAVILVFSATGVFVQLQAAMNRIWEVKQKPGQGVLGWLRKRGLSFLLLLAVLVLLLAETVASAALSTIINTAGDVLPGQGWIWELLNALVSVALFTVLFALVFKYFPDVRIQWHTVWIGALATAVLFTVGKFLLAWYIGQSTFGSSYGAAVGSFMALLVWVYYSAVIFLLGAEITQVYARRSGEQIEPNQHAMPMGA